MFAPTLSGVGDGAISECVAFLQHYEKAVRVGGCMSRLTPALTKWEVEEKKKLNFIFDLNADKDGGALQVGDHALLASYSPEMKALMTTYFGANKNEAADVQRYMPRGRNVGFVTPSGGMGAAIAHGPGGLGAHFPQPTPKKHF